MPYLYPSLIENIFLDSAIDVTSLNMSASAWEPDHNLTGWQNDKRQEIILPENEETDPDYCPTVDDTEGEYFVLVNEWFSYMKIMFQIFPEIIRIACPS